MTKGKLKEKRVDNKKLGNGKNAETRPQPSLYNISYSKGNRDIAMNYRLENMINLGRNNGYTSYPICGFNLKRLMKYGGVGTYLYFKFFKDLVKLFLILLLLALPQFLCTILGNHNPHTILWISKTTLGNLAGGHQLKKLGNIFGYDFLKNSDISKYFSLGFSALDLFGAIIFLFFLYLRRKEQIRYAKSSYLDFPQISDYTVRVHNLPSNIEIKRTELKNYFEKFGEVVDVAVVYDTRRVLEHLNEIRSLTKLINTSKKMKPEEIDQINERIRLHGIKIKRLMALGQYNSEHRPLFAFVTFKYIEYKQHCLKILQNSRCSFFTPQYYKFKKKYCLKVNQAPEPSNINYKNLIYGRFNKFLRKLLIDFITLMLLSISICTVVLTTHYQNRLYNENNSSSFCQNSNITTYLTPTEVQHLSPNNPVIHRKQIDCYCMQYGIGYISISNELRKLCSTYLKSNAQLQVSSVLLTFFILMVNEILLYVMKKLIKFEKHSSRTDEERSLMLKLFLSIFLNTGLIILILNADTKKLFGIAIFNGRYVGFTPDWYNGIGISIIYVMCLNTIFPRVFVCIFLPIYHYIRRIYATPSEVTQKKLNKIYAGNKFRLAQHYAEIANVVYVSYIYSSGMPVLLITALITLGFMYQQDKVFVLRYYRIPPKYDSSLAVYFTNLLSQGVLLHIFWSIWIYGSKGILDYFQIFLFNPHKQLMVQMLYESVSNCNSFLHICLFGIIVLILLAKFIFEIFIFPIKVSSRQRVVAKLPSIFTVMSKGLRFESYSIWKQEGYNDLMANQSENQVLRYEEPMWAQPKSNFEKEKGDSEIQLYFAK